MPHGVIEHGGLTEEKIEQVMEAVFHGCRDSGLFLDQDIKVRAITYTSFMLPSVLSSFVHVSLKIIAGRTPDQKRALSKHVFDRLCSLQLKACSITVEVCDIDGNSYQKHEG